MGRPYRVHHEPEAAAALAPAPPRPLGRTRSTHASGSTTKRILAGATGIAAVLAVLSIAWPSSPLLVALSFLLAVAVATWVVIANVLGLDVVAEVHDGGIVVNRSWRRARVVAFDDVRALYVARGLTDTTFVFESADGRRVSLPGALSHRERLVAAIESEVERPVLEDALRALSRGEPLTFGAITLELDGVRHRGELLPWSALDRVRVMDDGVVFVEKATQHAFVVLATRELPFPRVLVALLARRTHVDAESPFWMRWMRA